MYLFNYLKYKINYIIYNKYNVVNFIMYIKYNYM